MSLSLLGWRRAVAQIYAEVRANADPRDAHTHWRASRDRLFASHPDSPLLATERASFGGLPVGPYDPSFRFVVSVDTDLEPAEFAAETGTDGVVAFSRIGVVTLDGVGSLDVWWLEAYGGGLFVPIQDAWASSGTYGGGRYVIDTVKGADLGGDDDALVVDLNFAYNPSCAYDPAWACPLPPPGNVVEAAVPVGEMAWRSM
jgi:uncharacterized protein (DUF1684 family)